MSEGFDVPAVRHRVEIVIERSRFIATLDRAATPEDARSFIDEMRAEFPDATHNCWAFVAGPPGSTAQIGMSDAGEPHGTAGRPMLDVLVHSDVGEIAAVVTRYYGGTRLGTGGLVRAYGGAVAAALHELPRVRRVERVGVRFTVSYTDLETLRRLLAEHFAVDVSETFTDLVHVRAAVPRSAIAALSRQLADRTAARGLMQLD